MPEGLLFPEKMDLRGNPVMYTRIGVWENHDFPAVVPALVTENAVIEVQNLTEDQVATTLQCWILQHLLPSVRSLKVTVLYQRLEPKMQLLMHLHQQLQTRFHYQQGVLVDFPGSRKVLSAYNLERAKLLAQSLGSSWHDLVQRGRAHHHLVITAMQTDSISNEIKEDILRIVGSSSDSGLYFWVVGYPDNPHLEDYKGSISTHLKLSHDGVCYKGPSADLTEAFRVLGDAKREQFTNDALIRLLDNAAEAAQAENQESLEDLLDLKLTQVEDQDFHLVFGDTSKFHHGIMIGNTGRGKSTFLQYLMLTAMHQYKPEELQLYLIDLKQGTELHGYRVFSHVAGVNSSESRADVKSVLERVQYAMEHHAQKMREFEEATGRRIRHVLEYNRLTKQLQKEQEFPVLPRIILVIDEFNMLPKVTDDSGRQDNKELLEIMSKLVYQGRAFGIVVLCSASSWPEDTLPYQYSRMKANFGLRISLGNDTADYKTLFHHERTHLLIDGLIDNRTRGQAVVSQNGGRDAFVLNFGNVNLQELMEGLPRHAPHPPEPPPTAVDAQKNAGNQNPSEVKGHDREAERHSPLNEELQEKARQRAKEVQLKVEENLRQLSEKSPFRTEGPSSEQQ